VTRIVSPGPSARALASCTVIATQRALVRELAGTLRQRLVDADDHELGIECVELDHASR
jgi:hypothetical protein